MCESETFLNSGTNPGVSETEARVKCPAFAGSYVSPADWY